MNNDLQMKNPPHPGEILKELYILIIITRNIPPAISIKSNTFI